MSWNNFNFDSYGGAGFGHADLAAAQAAGMNSFQIRGLAQQASKQGRNIPTEIQSYLMQNTTAPPFDYGAHGGARFGDMDLQHVLMQGGMYADVERLSNWANENQIGTADNVNKWLEENKDNYAYMDAGQKREIHLADQIDAEGRARQEWERQQLRSKELNPRIASSNARMQTQGAGGVAVKRSEDFRREGGTRSTKQASRGMFIESLNI